jgi:hypothetical protein
MKMSYAADRPGFARAYALWIAVGALLIDVAACVYVFARVYFMLGQVPAGTAVRPIGLALESLVVTVIAVVVSVASLALSLMLDMRRRAIWLIAILSLVIMCLPYQVIFWAVDLAIRRYGLRLGD